MSDLIDRQALLDAMKNRRWVIGRASDPVCLVEDAPTIDAVEVVRCGECIHANTVGFCTKNELFIDDDWFCADGERREG